MSRKTIYKCDICEREISSDAVHLNMYSLKFTNADNRFIQSKADESGKHVCTFCADQLAEIVREEKEVR